MSELEPELLEPREPPWTGGKEITTAQLEFIRLERSAQRGIALVNALKEYGQITVVDAIQPGPNLTLTQLIPDSSGNWATEVRVLGTGFGPNTKLYGDETQVATTTFVSSTELRGVVPASAAGVYQVTAREGQSKSNALPFTAL